MARPRVFISSTFYDLKHVRASLDLFVQTLGFESVLSEKGDIAYSFDRPLDESCYAEVALSDIFVLIIGGRYGAAASDQGDKSSKEFYERYESITRREYDRAIELDIPIYILVDKAVHTEYRTYRANRDNEDVIYAHVDSVNIFALLDGIMGRSRNNAVYGFERFTDIEAWLRDQWAGLFRDLLKRSSQQAQLKALNEQVAEMQDINQTLQAYMEAVVTAVAADSGKVIRDEEARREVQKLIRRAEDRSVIRFLAQITDAEREDIVIAVRDAKSLNELESTLLNLAGTPSRRAEVLDELQRLEGERFFLTDLNEVRALFDRPPLKPARARVVRRRDTRPVVDDSSLLDGSDDS